MPKIFISTIPFGEVDPTPLKLLQQTGWSYIMNPLGRKLKPQEVAEFARDADGIIAGTENLVTLIRNSKKLKMISRVGIGLDSVPLRECKQKAISVSYTPDAVTMAVAEITLGVMIGVSRHLWVADHHLRKGKWERLMGKRIGESTIGLVGFGRIGSKVAHLLVPFSPVQVLVNDVLDKTEALQKVKDKGLKISLAEKEVIYKKADIISLHVPYSNQTKHMINENTLSLFKKDSFLINFARGEIVNENALYHALKNEWIKGAAIDVYQDEPYCGDLICLENVLLTPHIGSCSYDCRSQMEVQATEEMIRFFKGEPLHNAVPQEEYRYQEE